jgi:hypothetical protein
MHKSRNAEMEGEGIHDLALCQQTFLRPYDTTHRVGKKTANLLILAPIGWRAMEHRTAKHCSSLHHPRLPGWQRLARFESQRPAVWVFLFSLPTFLSLDISFFSLIFFALTARVIPLCSGLRAFCFHGSSPDSRGASHKAHASLRLHAPSLSLPAAKKTGQKDAGRQVIGPPRFACCRL